MTLQNTVLLAFSALTLVATSVDAQVRPGPSRPPIPSPHQPPAVTPLPPVPSRPGQGGGGQHQAGTEQKVVNLYRRVTNETLALRQLANIGANYNGMRVQSIVVLVRNSGPQADMSFLVNNQMQSSFRSPRGQVQFTPYGQAILGQDIQGLQLQVRGNIEIDQIIVNVQRQGNQPRPPVPTPQPPPPPVRAVEVPVYLNQRHYGNSRVDVSRMVDMQRYRDYRIEEIVIDATPSYNTALMEVLINSFQQGPTLQFDVRYRQHRVYPMNAVIGRGADSIILQTRGDILVHQVTLRLVR